MSISQYLFITHLLLATYSLFFWWKHDRLSEGESIDELARRLSSHINKQELISLITGTCLIPLVNLVWLYLIITDDLKDIYANWKPQSNF